MENAFDPFTANVQDAFGTASTTSTLRKEKKHTQEEFPKISTDPFSSFDAWNNSNNITPNISTTSSDPWGTSSNTIKTSTNLDDSFDPFSIKNQLKQDKKTHTAGFDSDPFSPSNFLSNDKSDPFTGSTKAFPSPSDPFSAVQTSTSDANKNFNKLSNSATVDFDAVFGPSKFIDNGTKSSVFNNNTSTKLSAVGRAPPNKSISLQKSETVANVPKLSNHSDGQFSSKNVTKSKKGASQSLSRPWGTPYLDVDSTSSSKPHKSHSSKFSHLGDLLSGSPMKNSSAAGHSDSNTSGLKESSTKEKKKKSSYLSPFRPKKQNSFSGVDKSKSAVDLSHMGVPTPSAPPQQGANTQMEALHVR